MAPQSLADIIRQHASERPDAPALDLDERSLTFGELDSRSSQVAHAAAELGVASQDHVAFIDKNGIEGYEVIFGLGKINAVNISVNWRLAPPEMAHIINDAEAKLLIVGPDFIDHVEQIEDQLDTVEQIIAIGGHDRWTDYEAWLRDQPTGDPGIESSGDHVAFQLYTSGTTGLPKGVMLTNDNLFRPDRAGRRDVGPGPRLGEPGHDAHVPHRRHRLGGRGPLLRGPHDRRA